MHSLQTDIRPTGAHIKVCPDIVVPCSNEGCWRKCKRRYLSKHQASCPKKIVSCRYSSVGCDAKITRQNIVSHNQKCMEQHLDSAVDTLDETVRKLDETCVSLRSARETLGILWNRVEQLEAKPSEAISIVKEEEDYHTEEYDYHGDQNCSECGGYHATYECCGGDDDDY